MISSRYWMVPALMLAASGSLMAQQNQDRPPAPPAYDEKARAQRAGNSAVKAYAADARVSEAEAQNRLAAQQEAIDWASELAKNSSGGIVEVRIAHQPAFKVEVLYNGSFDQNGIMASAPVSLRRYPVFRPSRRTKAEIEGQQTEIATALRAAKIRFGLSYDFDTEKFIVSLPEGMGHAKVREAVPPSLRGDVTLQTGATTAPIGTVYGGWLVTSRVAAGTARQAGRYATAADRRRS